MSKRFDRDALLEMAHKDVKARYQAMFGEPPRSPNKVWMVNQMEEEYARRKAARSAAASAAAAPRERVRSRRRATEPEAAEQAAEEQRPDASEAATEDASGGAPSPIAPATHVRGRLRSMTVEELRARYEQKVGRATSSVDKGYLVWKIREAEKGKIRVGPVAPGQRREGALAGADKTLPLTLSASAVEAMDAAWRRGGFMSRMSFMRAAIREALNRLGESASAALLPE
jgi:hypothetical protein